MGFIARRLNGTPGQVKSHDGPVGSGFQVVDGEELLPTMLVERSESRLMGRTNEPCSGAPHFREQPVVQR